jgi:hypothetical protein
VEVVEPLIQLMVVMVVQVVAEEEVVQVEQLPV